MTKRYADEQITISRTFRNDDGTATDPTDVTFTYRMERDGADQSATPTKTGTGQYQVQITPEKDGNLFGYFQGTGALVKTIPVHIPIFPKQVPVGR